MSHEIIQLKVEDHDNFIYIIADRETKTAAVVDPAWDADGIREVLEDENLDLVAIFITHSDHDHVNAVKDLATKDCAIFVHEEAFKQWEDAPVDVILISDGDEIQLGSASVGVLHTAGHTSGSCCFHTGKNLLTGDTLFIYGAGNVRNPTASAESLFYSLQRLKKLDPETKVWAGHDYGVAEWTTLNEQLKGNPFLLIDNKEDFILYRTEIAAKTRQTPYTPISLEDLQQMGINS